MDRGMCCCLSFDHLRFHSVTTRGFIHPALEALVVVEENIHIQMVAAAEIVCVKILQGFTKILAVL